MDLDFQVRVHRLHDLWMPLYLRRTLPILPSSDDGRRLLPRMR